MPVAVQGTPRRAAPVGLKEGCLVRKKSPAAGVLGLCNYSYGSLPGVGRQGSPEDGQEGYRGRSWSRWLRSTGSDGHGFIGRRRSK